MKQATKQDKHNRWQPIAEPPEPELWTQDRLKAILAGVLFLNNKPMRKKEAISIDLRKNTDALAEFILL